MQLQQHKRPIDRLERGPSHLLSHYMLGLAVGTVTPQETPRIKITRKMHDKISTLEKIIHKNGPSTIEDFARHLRRSKSKALQIRADRAVSEGRIIKRRRKKNGYPVYELPADYTSAEPLHKNIKIILDIMAEKPEGTSSDDVAEALGLSRRRACDWLNSGAAEGIFKVVRKFRIGYSKLYDVA